MTHFITVDEPSEVDRMMTLSNFDRVFLQTVNTVNKSIGQLGAEINSIKIRLTESRKARQALFDKKFALIARIKEIRATVTDFSPGCGEDDDGEFNGYESDGGWFEYGTPPSVKAMVELSRVNSSIASTNSQMSTLRTQIDSLRSQITTRITEYVAILRRGRVLVGGLCETDKNVARDIFCWGKLQSGICTHHQCGKCSFGEMCRKAHIPIICSVSGYPALYLTYTEPRLYM